MRINTNVSAINASNNLSRVQEMASESMAKLSSGFRINKAADDAAGLGIANKFHSDTRALTQASRNAEQANSLLQVAEGSTSTVQKVLERMKELATQAGSDTVDADARGRINTEFKQLRSEIQRTVDTTTFQGNKLLDGSYGAVVGKSGGTLTTVAASAVGSSATAVGLAVDSSKVQADTYTLTVAAGSGTTATATLTNGSGVSQQLTYTAGSTNRVAAADTTLGFTQFGISLNVAATHDLATESGQTMVFTSTGSGGNFVIGSTDGQYGTNGSNILNVSLGKLAITGANATTGLSLGDGSSSTTTDLDLSTASGARSAIANIDAGIRTVSSTLGGIGAAQNRISYALDNLKTTIANFSAAESVIRDVDMADEMTKFSKSNILAQAGTAMLAQANQAGQGVLQLLRG